MPISNTHRCTMLFEEGIKSKYTKRNYVKHIRDFERFANLDKSTLLTLAPECIQKLIEDYLIKLKQDTNPNSIPSKFQGIKHFCVMNRISLDWDIIYKMFPSKQKTQNLRSYTTGEVRSLLSNTKNIRDKALIHFLASTGARIGVFDHILTIDHLKQMPDGCIAVNLYAGHVEEYWAFLTPQASKSLKSYHNHRKQNGEQFYDNTPVFAVRNQTSTQLGWGGARSVIYRSILKSKINRRKHDHRYEIQADHGFRKRFNTILKLDNLINYNIAEKLMGHKNGLDGIYFTPTLEELFTEFKKIMHKIEV